jgi:hypothetical protein
MPVFVDSVTIAGRQTGYSLVLPQIVTGLYDRLVNTSPVRGEPIQIGKCGHQHEQNEHGQTTPGTQPTKQQVFTHLLLPPKNKISPAQAGETTTVPPVH